MKKGRVLRDDEARLWHKIAKSTRPISGKSLKDIEKHFIAPIEKPVENQLSITQSPAPKIEKTNINKANHKPHFPIADAKGHKRVRRGKLEIDAVLDLHGLNQEMAQIRLQEFVLNGISFHYRTLLVITGKGNKYHDNHEEFDLLIAPRGILRKRLKEWLHASSLKRHIAGISEAHLKHGGSGAFYVLLKAH